MRDPMEGKEELFSVTLFFVDIGHTGAILPGVTVTENHTDRKPKHERGPVKYPGITFDARTLKVSVGHLYQVLSGRRESAPLLARYRALKAAQHPDQAHLAIRMGSDPAEETTPCKA